MPPREEPEHLYPTTTGRRTGLPGEIEIWFTRSRGRYYVIAEMSGIGLTEKTRTIRAPL
jgi:hypothetical protein